jgi:hypothetical protein
MQDATNDCVGGMLINSHRFASGQEANSTIKASASQIKGMELELTCAFPRFPVLLV